jgi:hypothetical protein
MKSLLYNDLQRENEIDYKRKMAKANKKTH